MILFSVKNLSAEYDNHPVFKDISFDVSAGDFICIVGPNGSGKSTLLNCILGLTKAKSGKITFTSPELRKQLGFLPQASKINHSFPCSLYEVVSSGALNHTKLFAKTPTAEIDRLLKKLKIYPLRNRKFSELSGGQRQKALLARAILAGSKILILDEPSNNLDYKSRQDFYRTLAELNQNLTIIMVTHDLDHRNLLGNKILSLDPENFFFGPTESYVERIHHDL